MDNNLFSNIPEVISAAAQSNLGILALLSIALSVLAYTFFSAASEKVKVGIFTLLFVGVAGFGVAMFRTEPPGEMPPVPVPYDKNMPVPYDKNNDKLNADQTLALLKIANIDFSVRENILKDWINNDSTLYPAVSIELVKLLERKKLTQPVYLDVIVYKYQQAASTSSSSRVDVINSARLKTAVIKSYNERYADGVTDFKKLLQ